MSLAPEHWPQVELDPVRRLHVLAAAIPGAEIAQIRVTHPFERVWAYLEDIERSIPEFDQLVRRVRVRSRSTTGELRVSVHLPGSPPQPYRVRMEPGFMWMQAPARLYVVGMAATPAGPSSTDIAHLEGARVPWRRWPGRRWLAHHVRGDLDGLRRRLDELE